MSYLVKTEKGYVAYKFCGEFAFTQFKADAKRYCKSQASIVKKQLQLKGFETCCIVCVGS